MVVHKSIGGLVARGPSTGRDLAGWLVFALVLALVPATFGQSEGESMVDGAPLENAIVGRDVAVRIQGQIQFTEDDDDLINDDPAYVRFPSRLYSAKVQLLETSGSQSAVTYSRWENSMELDSDNITCDFRLPFVSEDFGAVPSHVSFRYKKKTDTLPDGREETDYWSIAYDKTLQSGWYTYTQYQYTRDDIRPASHELSEYLSYKYSEDFRIGMQGSISKYIGQDSAGPWFVRLFLSASIVPDWTALRAEAQYYNSEAGYSFQLYNAYLSQKLSTDYLVRMSYRYYLDDADLSSHALGLKIKHWFSADMSADVGYRYYIHSEGADFDTLYAGFSVLL
jgi:hypothetical protein